MLLNRLLDMSLKIIITKIFNSKTIHAITLSFFTIMLSSILLVNTSYAYLSYDQKKAMSTATKNTRNIDIKLRGHLTTEKLTQLSEKIIQIEKKVAGQNIPNDDPNYLKLKQLLSETKNKIIAMGGTIKVADSIEKDKATQPSKIPSIAPKASHSVHKKTVTSTQSTVLSYEQKKLMTGIKRQLSNLISRVQNINNINDLLKDEQKLLKIKTRLETSDIPKNDTTYQQRQQQLSQTMQLVKQRKAQFGPDAGPVSDDDIKQFSTDYKVLKMLSARYNPASGVPASDQSAQLWDRLDASIQWGNELNTKYAHVINSDSRIKQNFTKDLGYFNRHTQEWKLKVEQRAQDSITQVKTLLKQVEYDAKKGKELKKITFFQYGIPNTLEKAQTYFKFLNQIPKFKTEVAVLARRLEQAKKTVKLAEATLEQEILEANRAPKEIYQGADKADLRKRITSAWKKAYPNEKVLAVIFHKETWKRNDKITWNKILKVWEHSDWSYLPTSVVTKTNDTIATIYVAYINRNNLENGALSAGVSTRGGEHIVTKMLLKNYP
jgi:hypothetical protein